MVIIFMVDVDIVVISGSDDAVAIVRVSGFWGAKITNFNAKDRVTADIVRTLKYMKMILTKV
jgi:hypothetical protein